MKNVSYYKARIEAIYHYIAKSDDEKVRFWRNGFVIPEYSKDFKQKVNELIPNQDKSELSLTELMTFNTWFEIHPEKIAGIERMTTSRDFPIHIKGTKQDILNTINKTFEKSNDTEKIKRLRIAKAKIAIAMAKKKGI